MRSCGISLASTAPYGLGITIGKFYPFHRGHELMIRTAKERVDHLVVVCTGRDGETVSRDTRAEWIRECFLGRNIEVVASPDDLPCAPEPWGKRCLELLAGRQPDVALTGEDYGEAWAACMGCPHERLDTRITNATQLRNDLKSHWEWLTPPAKAHFCKRVAIVSADTSITTEMADNLALHFATSRVPQYAYNYWDGRKHIKDKETRDTSEFVCIARGQMQLEDSLARMANRVLICDTDILALQMLHRHFIGEESPAIAKLMGENRYDLYLLIASDDNGHSDKQSRQEMHNWLLGALEKQAFTGTPYLLVSGDLKQRMAAAVEAVEPLLSFEFMPFDSLPQN